MEKSEVAESICSEREGTQKHVNGSTGLCFTFSGTTSKNPNTWSLHSVLLNSSVRVACCYANSLAGHESRQKRGALR